jgi:hypothetical protein
MTAVIDATTVTVIGGIILSIITALVTGVISVITALRASSKIDPIAKDVEAIKGHVNSEKTASDGREVALRQEAALLREMLTDKNKTAALLAQAAAQQNTASVSSSDATTRAIVAAKAAETKVP